MGVLGSFWTHHKHGYWLGYLAIFILDPHDSQWLNGSYGVWIGRKGHALRGAITPVLRGGGSKMSRDISDVILVHFGTILTSPPPWGIYLSFNDFHCFWTKMLQLVAPAGDPRLKIT